MKINKILVPVDGSPGTTLAMRTAHEIALNNNAKIVALYIDPYDRHILQDGLGLYETRVEDEYEAKAHRTMEQLQSAIPEADFDREFQRGGHPADVIVDYAENQDVDLVVMASRGLQKTARRMFVGSVTSYVLHNLKKPILVIPVD